MNPTIPKTMLAVAVSQYETQLERIDAPVPTPKQDEVLIQVHASGLCSTDIHLLNGRQSLGNLPRILGHETAGEIVSLGDNVTNWQIGDRVVVAIDVVCGNCEHCHSGNTQRCQHKTRIGFERDGGHAEYVTVPAKNLVLLPTNISYKEASILPDAVACMYHCLVTQGQLRVNQKIVILGIGGLGIHGIQIARLAGAEVVATSRRDHRLLAAKEFGAIPVNTLKEDLTAVVNDFTDGVGADIVADCIGTTASIKEGLSLLRPGGKLLVIAYIDEMFQVPSIPLFSLEKEIIGCRGSTKQELMDVVKLVSTGKLQTVIGAEFPLSQIHQAVDLLEAGDMLGRIVLTR
ncbi:MAG TPA: zinc-binding dehydrogenase [Anaerolineaceae bacterium]|nr:zinc-binding dehydrogenase [Anaerolineaceae bacterium]